MAANSSLLPTLDPFSSTKPKERAPQGGIGFFNDFEIETPDLVQKSVSALSEFGSATGDLFQEIAGLGEKSQTKETAFSEQEKIDFNSPEQIAMQQARRVVERENKINQEVAQVTQDQIQKLAKEIERASGGEYGLLDALQDAQPHVANPDMNKALQIGLNTGFALVEERRQKMQLVLKPETKAPPGTNSAGFQMGENELGLGGENKQHFTQVAG